MWTWKHNCSKAKITSAGVNALHIIPRIEILTGGYKLLETVSAVTLVSIERDVHLADRLISLSANGVISIKDGYVWDGATCAIDTADFILGSLVHDALYHLIRVNAVPASMRLNADKTLCILLKKAGMSWFRRMYVYYMVRLFGRKAVG